MIEKEFKDNLKRLVNYEEVEVTMSYLVDMKEEDTKLILFADFETEKPFDLAYKYKKGNNYVELVELKTLKQLQKLDLDQLERVLELIKEMNQPEEEEYE